MSGSSRTAPLRGRRRRVHFPQSERHDRFAWRRKASREGGLCLQLLYSSRRSSPSVGPRYMFPPCPPSGSFSRPSLGVRLGWTDFSALRPRLVYGIGLLRAWHAGSVAIRSAPYPTRLETRTEESNIYSSHWEWNPKGAMKVKAGLACRPRCDLAPPRVSATPARLVRPGNGRGGGAREYMLGPERW